MWESAAASPAVAGESAQGDGMEGGERNSSACRFVS